MIECGAKFSPCRKYRYTLWRVWDEEKPMIAFLALNPSAADEEKNDPTVQRCINYAKKWGYGGMYMLNIFAFRATDPKVMKAEEDPVGEENDKFILETIEKVDRLICAWGNHGQHMDRSDDIEILLHGLKLECLGVNKSGEPKHPLYLKADLEPEPFV